MDWLMVSKSRADILLSFLHVSSLDANFSEG